LRHFVPELDAGPQIFDRREIGFECVQVRQISKRAIEVVACLEDRETIPEHFARFHRQQSRDTSQKTRLADAVRPDDLQQLAASQVARNTAQEMPFAAPQMQISHCKRSAI
jgi:hypothetical protein